MKIIYWLKGMRGISCLHEVLKSGYSIEAFVTHENIKASWRDELSHIADTHNIPIHEPVDPNGLAFEETLKSLQPDVMILGGYGKIIKQNIIDIPSRMTMNLHGGKLPEYRGSSPLNWALINGEPSFSISVIQVDAGVDTGPVLLDRTFEIDQSATIKDVHEIANKHFPQMLVEVMNALCDGTLSPRVQDKNEGNYYPLRFPDDGLILWDQLSAEQIHNRIRALTEPYPCAFTFFGKQKIKLLSSELHDPNFFGEPGRIYKKSKNKLLVCAQDRCLWVSNAVVDPTNEPLFNIVKRYDTLATVKGAAMSFYSGA